MIALIIPLDPAVHKPHPALPEIACDLPSRLVPYEYGLSSMADHWAVIDADNQRA